MSALIFCFLPLFYFLFLPTTAVGAPTPEDDFQLQTLNENFDPPYGSSDKYFDIKNDGKLNQQLFLFGMTPDYAFDGHSLKPYFMSRAKHLKQSLGIGNDFGEKIFVGGSDSIHNVPVSSQFPCLNSPNTDDNSNDNIEYDIFLSSLPTVDNELLSEIMTKGNLIDTTPDDQREHHHNDHTQPIHNSFPHRDPHRGVDPHSLPTDDAFQFGNESPPIGLSFINLKHEFISEPNDDDCIDGNDVVLKLFIDEDSDSDFVDDIGCETSSDLVPQSPKFPPAETDDSDGIKIFLVTVPHDVLKKSSPPLRPVHPQSGDDGCGATTVSQGSLIQDPASDDSSDCEDMEASLAPILEKSQDDQSPLTHYDRPDGLIQSLVSLISPSTDMFDIQREEEHALKMEPEQFVPGSLTYERSSDSDDVGRNRLGKWLASVLLKSIVSPDTSYYDDDNEVE